MSGRNPQITRRTKDHSRAESPAQQGRQRAESHTGQRVARGAGPYPREIAPVALPGDIVKLQSEHLDQPVIREIDAMIPEPTILEFNSDDGNDITVSGNDSDTNNELTNLQMPDGWLGQFRMYQPGLDLPFDIELQVDQGGQALPLHSTKNVQGIIQRSTGTEVGYDGTSNAGQQVTEEDINTQMMEFYVWEDEVPFFSFTNTTAGDETIQDMKFTGYLYRTADARLPDDVHPVPLPVGSIREGR